MTKVTPLQLRFCEEYILDPSPTRAARKAGFSNGDYGRQLINKPAIQDCIRRLQNQASKQTGCTIASVIQELAELYAKAREKGEYACAVRCLELLGRHVGAFEKDNAGKAARVVFVQNFGYDPRVKDLPPGSQLLEISAKDQVNE